MPLASTNCVGAVWWVLSHFLGAGREMQSFQLAVCPPSTLRMWPVMNLASSEAMKTIRVGDLLRAAEPTQRNLRRQSRLVLRRAGEAG